MIFFLSVYPFIISSLFLFTMPYCLGYIGILTLHLLDHSCGNLFSSTYIFCICFGKEHWQLWPKLPSVLAEIVLRFKHSKENYCLDNSTGALHHKKIPFSQCLFPPAGFALGISGFRLLFPFPSSVDHEIPQPREVSKVFLEYLHKPSPQTLAMPRIL